MAIFKKNKGIVVESPYDKADAVLNDAFSAFHTALQGTKDSIAVLDDHDREQDALIEYAQAEKAAVADKKAATQKLHDKLADFLG